MKDTTTLRGQELYFLVQFLRRVLFAQNPLTYSRFPPSLAEPSNTAPVLCGRSLRPYADGQSVHMQTDSPSLCRRSVRPYADGQSVPIWTVAPSLCGRTLRPYAGKNCTSLYNSCVGFCSHKTRLPTAVFRPYAAGMSRIMLRVCPTLPCRTLLH